MTKEHLQYIYIRANIEGRWESVSLQELIDRGYAGKIAEWFMSRIMGVVGINEGQIVTEDDALNMVNFLETIGITVVRLKTPEERKQDGKVSKN